MSHHPIDDIFRRKLTESTPEAPMHLWERIDQKRDWKHKLRNQLRLRGWPIGAGLLFTAITATALILSLNGSTEIQSFPIPQNGKAIAQAEISTPAPIIKEKPIKKITKADLPPKQKLKQQITGISSSPILAVLDDNDPFVKATPETTIENALDKKVENGADARFASLSMLNSAPALLESRFGLGGIFKRDPECAKFSKGSIHFYVDILASPDLTFRQLDAKNPVYNDYAESREATESLEYTFSTGLRLSAVSGFGLALRTGINYSQISEKFEYFNGSEVNTDIRDIYGPNGEFLRTDTIVTVGRRYKTTYNKYRTLDVPILLGYELDYKKFTFSLNGGAYVNLIFKQKGDFLSPQDLQPVNFSSNNPNAFPAFKNRLGLGWYGSISVQYQLKPNLQLLLEPHFKMYPKSVTQAQYIVDQRYVSTGLFVGIRHRL